MIWRTWAHPRGLLLLARTRAALGDLPGARAAAARLLEEWREADPSAPLLAAARETASALAG
jgi:hypothetical protein